MDATLQCFCMHSRLTGPTQLKRALACLIGIHGMCTLIDARPASKHNLHVTSPTCPFMLNALISLCCTLQEYCGSGLGASRRSASAGRERGMSASSNQLRPSSAYRGPMVDNFLSSTSPPGSFPNHGARPSSAAPGGMHGPGQVGCSFKPPALLCLLRHVWGGGAASKFVSFAHAQAKLEAPAPTECMHRSWQVGGCVWGSVLLNGGCVSCVTSQPHSKHTLQFLPGPPCLGALFPLLNLPGRAECNA